MLAWNMSLHAREIVAELARRASPSWESADGKLRQWEHHLRERDLERTVRSILRVRNMSPKSKPFVHPPHSVSPEREYGT